jgi:4-hydroxy-tetrahydrodipicolinate reductase
MLAAGLEASGDISVVAMIDPVEPPARMPGEWHRAIGEIDPGRVDVIVDFSTPDTTRGVIAWTLRHGVATVIGTTGLETADLDPVRRAPDAHVLVAPNFSVSAVLAERFAVAAAPYFHSVEVIELHHDTKVDAPSGTAISVARAIADARRAAGRPPLSDPTERETLVGSRGSDAGDGVRVHSVRLSGLVAHEEIIFGSPGEGLTIRQDSYDRASYVAGVVLAVRRVRDLPGLTEGIGGLLSA